MKKSIFILFSLCLISLLSCNKETADFDKGDVEIELREGNLMNNKACFELVYPVDIALPDESTITVESAEDFTTQAKAWYENNPDSKERPSLIYPVQINFEGDKSKVISSEEQMMRVKKYCKEKMGKKRMDCFRLIYPLTYILPDGSELSGENGKEMNSLLKEWYAANPDSEEKPDLAYPVDVEVAGKGIVTINSEEDMIAIKKRCENKEKKACFKLDFPVTFTMSDDSELTVNDEKEMNTSLKEWYKSNPDADIKPSLNYPVDVLYGDGKSLTVNNEEEMIKLKKRCSEK